MTRVLIVDDQPEFRRQLRPLLTYAGLVVVGEAGTIPEAEQLVATLQPDWAVVDVMLPGISGLEGVRRLQALAPELRIILISVHDSDALRCAAIEAGAMAFVPKDLLSMQVVLAWLETSHAGS